MKEYNKPMIEKTNYTIDNVVCASNGGGEKVVSKTNTTGLPNGIINGITGSLNGIGNALD